MAEELKVKFFKSPSEWRKWLEAHHAKEQELWVGFYKKDSGKPSITWPESVDGALCYGWIDGIRKSIDEVSYRIRFTPRKQRSIWSAVNIKRVQELSEEGLMSPAGLKAFEARQENRSGIYSYEQRNPQLPAPNRIVKKNRAAWDFFQSKSPSYRKAANWWVLSAKREETRLKRLDKLIQYSAQGQSIPQFTDLRKSK